MSESKEPPYGVQPEEHHVCTATNPETVMDMFMILTESPDCAASFVIYGDDRLLDGLREQFLLSTDCEDEKELYEKARVFTSKQEDHLIVMYRPGFLELQYREEQAQN